MIEANEVEYWASLGYVDKVRESIASGQDVNARGDNGYTALHAAVVNEHIGIVKILLELGADRNAILESGETPEDLARLSKMMKSSRFSRRRVNLQPKNRILGQRIQGFVGE